MAKSLRSKWKRKMKAVKRVRYGQKENDRLNKMVAAAKEEQDKQKQERQELGSGVSESVLVGAGSNGAPDPMDTSASRPKHFAKSMKNQHGNFPVWMSQRKIKQQKQKSKSKGTKAAEGKVNKRKTKKYL